MRDWIDSTEARTKAQARYDKEHTKGFYVKLNLRTDTDIIRWLWGQASKQGAIKRLIREEISHKATVEESVASPCPQSDGLRQSPEK